MEFIRRDGRVDITKLGQTLAEEKQLLAQVQQEVVAAQADNHAMLAARLPGILGVARNSANFYDRTDEE
jgi:hypothetical protein